MKVYIIAAAQAQGKEILYIYKGLVIGKFNEKEFYDKFTYLGYIVYIDEEIIDYIQLLEGKEVIIVKYDYDMKTDTIIIDGITKTQLQEIDLIRDTRDIVYKYRGKFIYHKYTSHILPIKYSEKADKYEEWYVSIDHESMDYISLVYPEKLYDLQVWQTHKICYADVNVLKPPYELMEKLRGN